MMLVNRSGQRGAFFLETVITLPVYILLLTGLVEIAKLLNTHILAAHLAYEGARIASKTQGLIINNPDTSSPIPKIINDAGKVVVRRKLKELGKKHGFSEAEMSDDRFEVEIQDVDERIVNVISDSTGVTGNKLQKIVVSVYLPYNSIMGFFYLDRKISSTSKVDYLFSVDS